MERGLALSRVEPFLLTDYVRLTKPRIISLLVVTAVCAMVPAHGGWPSALLLFNTIGGLSLSIGGAHAINMWYDRDIDQLMHRTRHRPVPTGRISGSEALWFGIFLQSVSFLWLFSAVNRATACLSLSGFCFYVFIYTMWLKRRTPQNIVIGGAAGAFPPLVGWAAVTGQVSWTSFMMFMIIFLWTPPHFWALALYQQEDYQRARLPMMPLLRGRLATIRQMAAYTLGLLMASLALYGLDPGLGRVYVVAAVLLGLLFLAAVLALWAGLKMVSAQRLFTLSLAYMAALFAAMVAGTFFSH